MAVIFVDLGGDWVEGQPTWPFFLFPVISSYPSNGGLGSFSKMNIPANELLRNLPFALGKPNF